MMYGLWWFGGFWMLIFWVALVWFVIWAVGGHRHNEEREPEKPIDVLKKSYAKGELTKKEYDEMKRDIIS